MGRRNRGIGKVHSNSTFRKIGSSKAYMGFAVEALPLRWATICFTSVPPAGDPNRGYSRKECFSQSRESEVPKVPSTEPNTQ